MAVDDTFGPLPKVLVLGSARHGKDTAAEILCELAGWGFRSSSLFVAEKAVFPELSAIYGYKSVEECYDDRDDHRQEWRNLIRDYNSKDRTKLARELLSVCNVYVGMRCHREYTACAIGEVFDHVLWVDASDRVGGRDASLTIAYDGSSMCTIDNNRTLADLRQQLNRWLNERQ